MINIHDLTFGYRRNRILFDHLSLSLQPGTIYGLLGKNGAGKTTLLKIICGLLFPKSGHVDVAGFKPRDRNPSFLNDMYLLPEEFDLPAMTADAYVRLYSPFYPRYSQSHFDDYFYEFKLPRDQKLSSMSYGQKKKFLLSFGMASGCRTIILDEPTNGLDIPSKSQFRKIISSAVDEERCFIISTHQVRDMENLIDPVIVLDEGRIIFSEDCSSIASKLSFSRYASIPESNGILYHEPVLGGYAVVEPNSTGRESKVNLELLFNAILENREKIEKIFKN